MHVGRKGGREGRLDGKKVEHQPSVSDSDFIAFSAKKDVDQAFWPIPQLSLKQKVNTLTQNIGCVHSVGFTSGGRKYSLMHIYMRTLLIF